VTDLARLLLTIFVAVLGFAAGWFARGWNDGSTVTTGSADTQAQSAVVAGADAAVSIDRAHSVTERAEERVRIVTHTVTVDGGCTPGAGAVSDALADDLRESIK
jgi:hypothetical protein